jgi:hypothetical protein
MRALRDLQRDFGRALLGHDAEFAAVRDAFADDPFVTERFGVYRNNVQASLTEVLRLTFPVVCRLVDERFIAYAADAFIRQHPPSRPALYEYGVAFADFLEAFPPCRALEYLPDVARLEWHLNEAATMSEEAPLAANVLAQFAPEETPHLRISLAAFYLESAWPLERIWSANQLDAADATIDLSSGGARLEIFRRDGTAAFRVLDPATFAFRGALAAGVWLGPALEKALVRDSNFAPAEALAALFRDGTVTAVKFIPSDQEPPS